MEFSKEFIKARVNPLKSWLLSFPDTAFKSILLNPAGSCRPCTHLVAFAFPLLVCSMQFYFCDTWVFSRELCNYIYIVWIKRLTVRKRHRNTWTNPASCPQNQDKNLAPQPTGLYSELQFCFLMKIKLQGGADWTNDPFPAVWCWLTHDS